MRGLTAVISELMAGPTAKVAFAWRQVQVGNATIARTFPIPERTRKPPTLTAEMDGRRLEEDRKLDVITYQITVSESEKSSIVFNFDVDVDDR